jgi:hypothetical protein
MDWRIYVVMANTMPTVVESGERPGRVWASRSTGDWLMAVEW